MTKCTYMTDDSHLQIPCLQALFQLRGEARQTYPRHASKACHKHPRRHRLVPPATMVRHSSKDVPMISRALFIPCAQSRGRSRLHLSSSPNVDKLMLVATSEMDSSLYLRLSRILSFGIVRLGDWVRTEVSTRQD